MFEKILFPTDFSEYAQKTLEFIGDIPGVNEVVLLPVDFSIPAIETLSLVKAMKEIKEAVFVHVVDKGETQEEIETSIQEAKKRFEDIAKDFRSEGIKVKIHVLAGSPSESIISLAEEENASLIIISTLGKGMFRELLLGGTARDVARRQTGRFWQ